MQAIQYVKPTAPKAPAAVIDCPNGPNTNHNVGTRAPPEVPECTIKKTTSSSLNVVA